MERHASALKAARQAVKRQAVNQATLSRCKTVVKNLRAALAQSAAQKVSSADLKKKIEPLFNEAQRTLMKAVSKKVLKKENASRKISRLGKEIHKHLHA